MSSVLLCLFLLRRDWQLSWKWRWAQQLQRKVGTTSEGNNLLINDGRSAVSELKVSHDDGFVEENSILILIRMGIPLFIP